MSEPLPAPAASNTFERIKRVNAEGQESWSARDLARVLEYTDFRRNRNSRHGVVKFHGS